MSNFRQYNINTPQYNLYKKLYTNQTVEFVKSKLNQYSCLNNCQMYIHDVLSFMDTFIDPSDPDTEFPNSIHAYQTAEKIRKRYPKDEEFQICGLIHDFGKILYKFNEPDWAVVGDTFVVGCEYPKTMIYYDLIKASQKDKYGIYEKNCGIENLLLSFGHDQYLYNVLQKNNHYLTKKYQNLIRFHSFYPWHTHNEYRHLMKDTDYEILKIVQEFNEFDLYSKKDISIISMDTREYYSNLLNKYFPNKLNW